MTTQEKTETSWDIPVGGFDNFKDAAVHLRRPFAPQAIGFKVQSTFKKGDKPSGGLIVSFVNARAVIERLNRVVPGIWSEEYKQLDGKHMICRIKLGDLPPREDVGATTDGGFTDPAKTMYSDSFKRAAVKWGVGISIYAMSQVSIDLGPNLKANAKGKVSITPAGDSWLRKGYQKWLDAKGEEHFGKVLDHGDDIGAVGEDAASQEPVELDEFVDEKKLAAQQDKAQALYDEIKWNGDAKKMTPGNFTALVNAAKTHDDMDAVISRVRELAEKGSA